MSAAESSLEYFDRNLSDSAKAIIDLRLKVERARDALPDCLKRPMIYDPSMDAPPIEVIRAASLVSDYMQQKGCEWFAIGNLCSRNHAERLQQISHILK